MVDIILVAAAVKSIEELLSAGDIPYEIADREIYDTYMRAWEGSDKKDIAYSQARPAVERIFSKEQFIYIKDGAPLRVRLNDQHRRMEDSFSEIMLERPDLDWYTSISVKLNANIIATLPFAGREPSVYESKVIGEINEIDDFGDRIFGVPCSNEYFDDMNEVLLKIAPHDEDSWREFISNDEFIYDTIITPILRAIGAEIPRICKDHPEAPQRLFDYFYSTYDYYFIKPIPELGVTRIGAINPHGGLGRMPDNDNLNTPSIPYPTELLDVRFATGPYGELSRDTLQFAFDNGWSLCLKVLPGKDRSKGHTFELSVYLPVTPFGSYRDQVEWDPEV